MKKKHKELRRFENTGLTAETLKVITDKEIERLTERLDPVAQRDFDSISPRAKKILFDHGSMLLQKYDPKMHESLQHRLTGATDAELLQEREETMNRMKVPILKLRPKEGGPSILYSEKSLKELAINDSSYLMEYHRCPSTR